MTRFLCFPLLFVLVFPLFAQEEPSASILTLPRDPTLLSRMKEQLSHQLQNTQRMLIHVNPSDTQLVDALTTQQAEFSKQLREISELMQSSPQLSGMPTARDIRDIPQESTPLTGQAGIPSMMPQRRDYGWQMQESVIPQTPTRMLPGMPEPPVQPPYNQMPPMPQMYGPPYGGPNWADQDRTWEATPWGPRLPKELTDLKQSIESLKKEIGELKDTIKALETQIQLLSRNILLNERIKESGNGN